MKTQNLILGIALILMALVLPSCKKEKTPEAMTITEIRINSFPATDAGAGWDLTSGADLYIQVTDANGNVLFDSPTYFENATGTSTLTFTPSASINLNCPLCEYGLRLYDLDDLDADDLIGSYSFTPYSYGSNEKNETFQSITFSGSDVSFSMDFTYSY